jgi:YidC/Oxa1 family membrane protein insertase
VNPLNPLYDAVAWVLSRIYGVLSPVFGPASGWTWTLTIVLLVVFMRLLMVPLFIKQMHTTRRMTALAPQMTVLRKKYKGDKQTLNQEMMKLYQEAGVNPLMGCLPVAAQLPMFFALFSVLRAIAEWQPGEATKYGMSHAMVASAQNAKILGVTIADKFLTAGTPLHVRIVILLTVIVSMITTYLTVRQSMKRGMMPAATPDNPMGQSQKYMAYIMPFFALSGLYWPFGLVLYWVTTNLWTLGQQYVLFMRYPMPLPAGGAAGSAPAESNGSAKPSTVKPSSAKPSSAKPSSAKPSSAKPSPAAGGNKQPGGKPRPPSPGKPASGARPAGSAARPAANGKGAGIGGGMLRRLGKGRAEPEAAPEAPEVKLVRQQRQRQSRSKRSGKR